MSLDDQVEIARFTDDIWAAIKPALKEGRLSGQVGTTVLLVTAKWLSVASNLSVGEFIAAVGQAHDAVEGERMQGGQGPGGLH